MLLSRKYVLFALVLRKHRGWNIHRSRQFDFLHNSSDRHHTILIAEDVYENYFLLETLFGKQYQLYHALNGQEAIDMFETYHPDLILMDIKMPVMDGFEATRRIRTLSKTIPIIALTAFAFEREKEIAKQCEFTDYVVKPIDIKELKKLIAKVLA